MPSSFQIHRINSPPTTTTTNTVSAAVMDDGHDRKNGRENQTQNQNPTWVIPGLQTPLPDNVSHYHNHVLGPTQGCSAVVQTINADVDTVWSVVRRFDNPQAYKHFLKSCQVITGDGKVGTLREVQVVSGLPAATSTERLEILDDENHVISFSVVGGEHRLTNYRSVTTLHATTDVKGTVVVESYVVDIPEGNTKEETCVFADTIVRCNLLSLAKIAENLVKERNDLCTEQPEYLIR